MGLLLVMLWGGCSGAPSSTTGDLATGPSGETVTADGQVDAPDLPVTPDAFEVGPPPDETLLPVYELSVTPEDWATLYEDVQADVTVPASLTAFGVTYVIALELHGQSSRKYPKTNFKFKFPAGQLFMGDPFGEGQPHVTDRLIVKAQYRDQSFMREAIAYDILRLTGATAPRVGFCVLHINGSYHGLYTPVEKVDERYIDRVGLAPDGSLYKAVDGNANFKVGMDLAAGFEKKTHQLDGWEDLEWLAERLTTTSQTEAAYMLEVDPIFPLLAFWDRVLWLSYIQMGDGWHQNYYLYNTPMDGHDRWHLIPWDSDICMSSHWDLSKAFMPYDNDNMIDGYGNASKRMFVDDALRHRYVDRYEEAIEIYFVQEDIDAIVSAHAERVRAEAEQDLLHWERSSTFEAELAEITLFWTERPALIAWLLEEFRDNPDIPNQPPYEFED